RSRGAYVIATSSKANIDFVKQLGADEVIDYRERRFEEAGTVDVIFDTVGGETLDRSWDLLKPSGRVVTIPEVKMRTDTRKKKGLFLHGGTGGKTTSFTGNAFRFGEMEGFCKS